MGSSSASVRSSAALQQQIRSNAARSVLLLIAFPLILPLLLFCVISAALAVAGQDDALTTGGSVSLLALAAILALTFVWLPIAYLINQWIIDRATGARLIAQAEEPGLWNLLAGLCAKCGMKMPALRIVETPELNAFASGLRENRYSVTVTRGLMQHLNDDELVGVLAHELTHIRNRDVRLLVISQILAGIIPIITNFLVRAYWLLIMSLLAIYRTVFTLLPMPGAKLLLTAVYNLVFIAGKGVAHLLGAIGYICSLIISFTLSRRREFMADAGAVEMTGNIPAMVSALRKVAGHSDMPVAIAGVREMCFDNPRLKGFEGLFATHPPMERRIEALLSMAAADEEPLDLGASLSTALAEPTLASWSSMPQPILKAARSEVASLQAIAARSEGRVPQARPALESARPRANSQVGDSIVPAPIRSGSREQLRPAIKGLSAAAGMMRAVAAGQRCTGPRPQTTRPSAPPAAHGRPSSARIE